MSGKDNNIIDKSEHFLKIQKAVKEKDEFLEAHPELSAFQKEIDEEMEKAGSWENKAAVLKEMMDKRVLELKQELLKMQIAAINVGIKDPQSKH